MINDNGNLKGLVKRAKAGGLSKHGNGQLIPWPNAYLREILGKGRRVSL